jgi:hypothetical protein
MTEAGIPADRLVRTALELLPVPDHSPDFWRRLGAAIDAEVGVAPAALADAPTSAPAARAELTTPRPDATDPGLELAPDPPVALVPAALRRTSNAVLVAVAAAAVVVVALAGSSLLESRQGTTVDADSSLASSASLDALLEEAQADAGTPSTMSPGGLAASSSAVLAWVDDLRAGHGEEAWRALGSESQAHFGSQAAFEGQLTSLAADYGSWAAGEPDQVLVTPVLTDGDSTIAVVTLVSTVTVAGSPQHRADAFPVRVVDGVVHVEPFALAGPMEVVVPDPTPSDGLPAVMTGDDELVIVVPSDAQPPVLRLDDGPAVVCGEAEGTELIPLADTPGQRCAYSPVDGISAGEHTLTMAFVGADGASISADSLLFDAA